MPKPIRSLDFSFVPFPAEVWDENIPLSLVEFRLLGYLCKQIRFGEALRSIADDELMKGIFEDGRRKDQGCGLSRNGVKQAREALIDRGWLAAENVSDDATRPRWLYRLLLGKKGEVTVSQRDSADVPPRQLVSQRDTVSPRQQVSGPDSAVSQGDSDGVTARQQLSPADTCNKEEESTKYLDKELESTKRELPPAQHQPAQRAKKTAPGMNGQPDPQQMALSPNVAEISQDNFRKRMKEFMDRIGDFWHEAMERRNREAVEAMAKYGSSASGEQRLFNFVRNAAKACILDYAQVKQYLYDHPGWCDWPYLKDLDSQQEIAFPEPAKRPQSTENVNTPWWHGRLSPEQYQRARNKALEYLATRAGKQSTEKVWRELGTCLGTLSANAIDEFVESIQQVEATA